MRSLILLILITIMTGCGGSGYDSSELEVKDMQKVGLLSMGDQEEFAQTGKEKKDVEIVNISPESKKMLIKNGEMEIEVKDIISAKNEIIAMLKKYKAYFASESLSKNDYRFDYFLSIRIPSSNFENFLSGLVSLKGNVTTQHISSDDVTMEYRDNEIRLENKKAYLVKYRQILKQAKTVKEILEVEEQIRKIEEEIESVKGKIKYLADQVRYSTLNLNLYQINNTIMKPPDSFFSRFWSSIINGWTGLTEFILIFVMLWPFLLIGIIIFFVLYKWVRKPSKKKEEI